MKCLVEVGNGTIDIAFGLVRQPAAIKSIGGLGIDTYRRIKIGDGMVDITPGCISVAPAVVSQSKIWIERERLG